MMHNLNSFTTIESDNESRLSSIAIDVESQESISNKNQDTNRHSNHSNNHHLIN